MFFSGISYKSIDSKKISLSALLCLFMYLSSSGQSYLTLNSGVNFSNITGVKSETFHSRSGYYFGMGYHSLFSDPFSFGTGLSLHVNGISRSYTVSSLISEFTYVNNVDQLSLHIPFLLSYHSSRFRLDFGPYFRNVIRSWQTETEITEYRTPDRERLEQTFINRQELYSLLVGTTFGVNLKVYRGIDLSFKYNLSFTPPGAEYGWQRQRGLNAGITFNLGKNFTPGRLSSGRPVRDRDDGDYQTFSSTNIVRVQYRYLGEGNNIVFRFRTSDKAHYRLVEMVVGNSSGELRSSGFQNSVWDAYFPFLGNVRFSCVDPVTSLRVDYDLFFELAKTGNWEVIIHY